MPDVLEALKGMVGEVLDRLGGSGASLLGHNHPEIVERAKGRTEGPRGRYRRIAARAIRAA